MWSLFCGKKQVTEVVPFATEASKAKHILVKSYEDKIGDKIGIPIFVNSDNATDVFLGDKELTEKHNDNFSKQNPETTEPAKPYYLKEASRIRINQVQPQPRSIYLTRTLPTGPTKKRSKLLQRGGDKPAKKKHLKKDFKKSDKIHFYEKDYE